MSLHTPAETVVDSMLEEMAGCLPPEVLAAMAAKQWTPEVAERLEALGMKASEGSLTPEERAAYEQSIALGDVLTLLKLKAQLRLRAAA